MKKGLLPFIVLLGGVVLALVMVFNRQIFQQGASVATLSSFAVKGSIYVDINANGKKDTGEVNYTGDPKPIVRLALFTQTCHPTPSPVSGTPMPTPHTTVTPTPTLAPNCHYFCPKVACIQAPDGSITCPACTPTCTTPAPNGKPSGVVLQNVSGKVSVGSVVSSEVSKEDVQGLDACKEIPAKIIPCTVNDDGTYSCIVDGVTFNRASLILNAPAQYAVTTGNNPFAINAADYQKNPSAIVDFGIAQKGTVPPPPGCFYKTTCTIACPTDNPNCCPQTLVCTTPTPSVKPACIPQPDCLVKHTCTYATPPQGWCSPTGKPLTSDELNRLMIYLNTLLRKQLGR